MSEICFPRGRGTTAFPIENADFIWLWVDLDKDFRQKYISVMGKEPNNQRFSSIDEIKYSMRSYDKYIKWHKGRVILVTCCNQVPSFIDKSKIVRNPSEYKINPRTGRYDKVLVIDHRDYIPEEFLPTFSSFTIESFLHKIPYITPIYVEFNDDMIALSNIEKEHFQDQKTNQLINWHNGNINKCNARTPGIFEANVCRAAKISEVVSHRYKEHVPWVIDTDIQRRVQKCHDKVFEKSNTSKSRSIDQTCPLTTTVYFMENIGVGKYLHSEPETIIYSEYSKLDAQDISFKIRSGKYSWICINNFEEDLKKPSANLSRYMSILDMIAPEKSRFETDFFFR